MNTLDQNVVVITGAGSGLGRSLAYELSKRGAIICLLGRNEDRLKETAKQVEVLGGSAALYALDVSNDAQVDSALQDMQTKFGGVDVLIHSAAVITLGTLQDASIEDLDLHYRVNVRAPYYITQKLLANIIERKGQIVFINSTMGVGVKAGTSQYAAMKHALRAIADTLREEVNGLGVRVLSVFPGKMATAMQRGLSDLQHTPYMPEEMLQPEDVSSTIVHALSLPRTAEVTEIRIRPAKKIQ